MVINLRLGVDVTEAEDEDFGIVYTWKGAECVAFKETGVFTKS